MGFITFIKKLNVSIIVAFASFAGATIFICSNFLLTDIEFLSQKAIAAQENRPEVVPAAFEPGEHLPGGKATSRKSFKNKNAFSHSSGNMGFEKELLFKVGNGLFRKLWVSSPSSTKSSDGLGPLFNARSCQRCHLKDGRGHTPEANWPDDTQVSLFLRLSIPPQTAEQKKLISSGRALVIPEPTYGGQFQDLSIQGHQGEGHMDIRYEYFDVTLADGTIVQLRRPHYTATDLKYGPMQEDVLISPRLTPPMIGLGLLDAIPSQDILQFADPDDQDSDGISGKANMVWSVLKQKIMLGRFGWKAGSPSVKEQSAGAFSGDIGLSTSLHKNPAGDCTPNQTFCLKAPHGVDKKSGVEVTDEMLDLVTFYASNLAVPRRRDPQKMSVLKGKSLFHSIGCASCHRPSFKTGPLAKNKHLSQQLIWPYTDMLLHNMGEGLADHRPEGKADGFEWRTPPLWGVGLTKTVNGHENLLHDGRARSVEEAILWHGGEALKARDAYSKLSKAERMWLVEFVRSL